MKAAKKQAKKEKRAAEGKSAPKSSTSKPKPDAAKALTTAGTGTSYKSKEYIESSDGSSN